MAEADQKDAGPTAGNAQDQGGGGMADATMRVAACPLNLPNIKVAAMKSSFSSGDAGTPVVTGSERGSVRRCYEAFGRVRPACEGAGGLKKNRRWGKKKKRLDV